ncbi:MAG: T9SS type A sorting domain-containing protein [Paludibacter sp.]
MKIKKTILLFLNVLVVSILYGATYPDLRTVLNNQSSNSVIDVPKGTYTLDLISSGAYSFINKKNVTINGNGSTIICNRQKQCFSFTSCENVVFNNFYIEYDPPCCTQGTINAISSDKKTWDITIHDGYPVDSLEGTKVQVFGQSTLELVKNFGDIYGITVSKTGTRTFRLTGMSDKNSVVQLGDYVVLDVAATGTNIPAHGIILNACKNMSLDSITMYDSNCFSFYEYDCEKTHYYRCGVTRKPYDSKYTIQRLRAGSADGIHSKFAKIGPIIEECKVEYNGDDCIAVNGNFYPVYDINATSKSIYMLCSSSNLSDFKISVGDSIVCVNNDGSIRGKGVAKSISAALTAPTTAQLTTCYAKLGNQRNQFANGFVVTIDNWIAGMAISDIFYSMNRSGAGFKVINNQVGHNRSRAILIKSSNGIISGNTVVGSAMSGIAVAPEFYWMEAGCPSNIEISNNTIRNCMYNASMTGQSQAGALVVVSSAPQGGFSPAGGLKNYNIHDNVIDGCPRPCVVLTSIDGVNYYNNTTTTDLTMIRTHGSSLGVLNTKDFWKINVVNFTSINTDVHETKLNPENLISIDKNGNISIIGMEDGETAQLFIFDLPGRMLLNKKISNTDKTNLSQFNKGVYIVSLKYNQSTYSRKIILP